MTEHEAYTNTIPVLQQIADELPGNVADATLRILRRLHDRHTDAEAFEGEAVAYLTLARPALTHEERRTLARWCYLLARDLEGVPHVQ